jgi:hypothetical protein
VIFDEPFWIVEELLSRWPMLAPRLARFREESTNQKLADDLEMLVSESHRYVPEDGKGTPG